MVANRLMKHNPAFLTADELKAAFVVRNKELELLLEIIKNNTGPVNQHVIIIAPRGMGKTMLVHRLALAVEQAESYKNAWYPVVLPEELYDVASEGELWLRVLQRIGDLGDGEGYQRIQERFRAIAEETDHQRLKVQALASLTEFASRKRLLIIIENLQMILGEQTSDDDAWDLRQTLLNHPDLMIVSTATTHFGEILNAEKANYELFREVKLNRLNSTDCRLLWQSITGEELSADRIRPMEILTGGSPRLLAILADFGSGKPLRELLDNLVVLLDDHTTYFKANVESLANQERRVFVTLAELWEPSRARDVAHRCRLKVNVVSALLKRLVERGIVAQVDQKGRVYYYQVTERLYNIYHLMRLSGSAGNRVKALVRCMVPIYGETRIACALASETCQVDEKTRDSFVQAYRYILKENENKPELLEQIFTSTPNEFFKLPQAMELRNRYTLASETENDLAECLELFKKIGVNAGQREVQKAIAQCDTLIRRFGQSDEILVLNMVAAAMVDKGIMLSDTGKTEEAQDVFAVVVDRFDGFQDDTISMLVFWARLYQGIQFQELGKINEALQTSEKIIHGISSSWGEIGLSLKTKAMLLKGLSLERLNRLEESLSVFSEAVDSTNPMDEVHVHAATHKIVLLETMERFEEAISTIDEMIATIENQDNTESKQFVASQLIRKGRLLIRLMKPHESLAAYESLIGRFKHDDDRVVQQKVTIACVLKGNLVFYLEDTKNVPLAISDLEMLLAQDRLPGLVRLTLARLFTINHRWDDAFEQMKCVSDDETLLVDYSDDILGFYVDAAANGFAEQALNTISKTAATASLEPLVIALKMILNVDFRAPQEVVEVASDIVKRIEVYIPEMKRNG